MIEQKRKTKGIPDLVDKHVGKQLRNRRMLMGLSQEKLAEAVGVTFQQIQKYERGANRISASRLFSFSKVLNVSIDYFYIGLDEDVIASNDDAENMASKPIEVKGKIIPEDLLAEKETLDLIRAFYSVTDESVRRDMLRLVKSMAKV